jgi:hypothetical protein
MDRGNVTEFKAAPLRVPPNTNTTSHKNEEIGPLTDIVNRTNEAISIIARIKKERETAVKVIDGAENAIKTIYSSIDNDPAIVASVSVRKNKVSDQVTNTEPLLFQQKPKKYELPKISSLTMTQIDPSSSHEKKKHKTSSKNKVSDAQTVMIDIPSHPKENIVFSKTEPERSEIDQESRSIITQIPQEIAPVSQPNTTKTLDDNLMSQSQPQPTPVKVTMNDKALVDPTRSLVWNDINLLPYARSTNGNFTYREFVKFNYSEDGSIIIQQLALPVNEGIEFTAEMPRNWKNNTMIVPHLHWTPATDMFGLSESINLTWMIKSVGTAFEDSDKTTQNTFNQLVKIGPEKSKVHVQTNFVPGSPVNLTGHNQIVVGHLRRLTGNSSYTDDIFIVGLDLSIIVDPNHTDS